jgi:hypothetical protein
VVSNGWVQLDTAIVEGLLCCFRIANVHFSVLRRSPLRSLESKFLFAARSLLRLVIMVVLNVYNCGAIVHVHVPHNVCWLLPAAASSWLCRALAVEVGGWGRMGLPHQLILLCR